MSHPGYMPVDVDFDRRALTLVGNSSWLSRFRAFRKLMRQATRMVENTASDVTLSLIEMSIAIILLVLTIPIWLLALATTMFGRSPFTQRVCLGMHGKRFTQYEFASDQMIGGNPVRFLGLQKTPLLLSLLMGSMRLVGPRSVTVSEVDFSQATARHRLAVKPGLVSPWRLRQLGNIAYEPEWTVDLEYVQKSNLWNDLGIILRSLPSFFIGRYHSRSPQGELFGIPFDNVTMNDAIDQICHSIQTPELTQVAFINADCINKTYVDDNYQDALKHADRVYADGVGVRLAGRILGCPIRENVNGTDMFPRLCRRLSKSSTRVFLLGGRPGVAESVGAWMNNQFPDLNVCGIQDGYYSSDEQQSVLQRIISCDVDVIFVAFGAPKQDVWIRDVLSKSNVRVAIGVGGLFDFYSGRIPRAPAWMREMGLEWTFRLLQEPGRLWRRYVIGNVIFLGRAVCYRIARPKQVLQNNFKVGSNE
jgi:N-acetylglucosaminyldiphosphoundecaprenol N-acetyl-beta-D-mannosaminyltransferase